MAEGLAAAQSNPASVAQRNRHLARGWDWDWLLTWYVPDPRDVATHDLDNDATHGYEASLWLQFSAGTLDKAEQGQTAGPLGETVLTGCIVGHNNRQIAVSQSNCSGARDFGFAKVLAVKGIHLP